MNKKEYVAVCRDGKNNYYQHVSFYSLHRANSKKNIEDAYKEIPNLYGDKIGLRVIATVTMESGDTINE